MYTDKEQFKAAFLKKLQTMHGKSLNEASMHDKYTALSNVVRDCISKNWLKTNQEYLDKGEKQVYYFSIEFLIGKLLDMNLIYTGMKEICQEALQDMGIDLEQLEALEPDAGLGNGGLGRLAACFLTSMAALQIAGHGCGIRYKYGLFKQKIVNNYQVELPDNWLNDGYVWEIRKAEKAVRVKFGGTVRMDSANGKMVFIHENYEPVLAVPYDIPIAGYQNKTVNTLRLWSAEPIEDVFDLSSFNRGDYLKTVEYKHAIERISKILYPDDTMYEGRLLRLKQQYFFVTASVQSIIRRFKQVHRTIHDVPEKIAIHINDTHPTMAIPELMRILIDEEGVDWDTAWKITTNTISYTNHTIMPEALEKWPIDMFKSLLPRIYMIIHEINERFCRELWSKYPGEWDRISQMAILSYGYVHMAHLAMVGSYSINGVAQVHTDILKKHVMKNFNEIFPYKFNNKTNGITHRRWLLKANPALAHLITDTIGDSWIHHPKDLCRVSKYADDAAFQEQVAKVKLENKAVLAKFIKSKYNLDIDLHSIFDIQIKRIHAYKRQILNVFHIMDLYNRLRNNPRMDIIPRTFIFAGKAAPGYYIAKQTIKIINVLASLINNDKSIHDKIKIVFLEDYGVSLAELIFPAANVSEQLSTASKEASGTGNMKLMMNGAVTIGTLDGANIEIRDAVGDDNIIIFGLRAEQVLEYYQKGGYSCWDVYHHDARIRTILEQLVNGFLPDEREEFRPIYDSLLHNNDEFFVLKDFAAYVDAQSRLEERFKDTKRWNNMCIHNIAQSGIFSSDRTISEYAIGIWNVKPIMHGNL